MKNADIAIDVRSHQGCSRIFENISIKLLRASNSRVPGTPVITGYGIMIIGIGRVIIGIVHRVHVKRQRELLTIAHAVDGVSLLLRLREGWQQHGRQDSNNRNDDEQFDQRESTTSRKPWPQSIR